MPDDTAIQTADQFRAALLSKERTAAVRLVNAYGDVYRRLQAQIDALTAELDALAASGESPKVWKVGKLEQLRALQNQIEAEVSRYAAIVENEINQEARE